MKLTLHDDINALYIAGSLSYNDPDFVGIEKAKLEATVSTGYTEKTLPEEWDDLKWLLDSDYNTFRNDLISTFSAAAVWDILSNDSKKALVRNNVWKSTETQANLDLLYTQTERDQFLENTVGLLNDCDCNLNKESNGVDYWNVVPDNTGTLITTKLKTDGVI